jgi:hypothetical protein
VTYDPSSNGRRSRVQPRDAVLILLAVALVAALLPALSRRTSDQVEQPPASTLAGVVTAQATPTPREQVTTRQATTPVAVTSPTPVQPIAAPATRPILLAVSQATDNPSTGYVTAWDAATGGMLYRIATGANADAVLSPDGTRLYVASAMPPAFLDELVAYDAATGDEQIRTRIQGRVHRVDSSSSGLAVSRDGSRLFTYSREVSGAYRIRIIDTADMRVTGGVEIDGCTTQLYPSANDRLLYVVCRATGPVQVVNLDTLQPEADLAGIGGWTVGSAISVDGRTLYVLSEQDGLYDVATIDTSAGKVVERASIALLGQHPLRDLALVALSPDGSTLYYGMGESWPGEPPAANQIWTWDTAQRNGGTHITARGGITGATLAAGPDAWSVFAVRNDPDRANATILRLVRGAGPATFAWHDGEQVLRLFGGTVADASAVLTVGGACPITPWGSSGPVAANPNAYAGWWISSDGVWVSLEPTRRGAWMTGANRVLWIRQEPGDLSLSGRRIDAVARPMEWSIADADRGLSKQLAFLTFPTPGCWEVTGVWGTQRLTFVVEVTLAGTVQQRDAP